LYLNDLFLFWSRSAPGWHRARPPRTVVVPVNRRCPTGIEMNEKLLGELAARLADLVTREEFDVQSEVLARARIRVAELESRVASLEARLQTSA
jgi:hypothetical protein